MAVPSPVRQRATARELVERPPQRTVVLSRAQCRSAAKGVVRLTPIVQPKATATPPPRPVPRRRTMGPYVQRRGNAPLPIASTGCAATASVMAPAAHAKRHTRMVRTGPALRWHRAKTPTIAVKTKPAPTSAEVLACATARAPAKRRTRRSPAGARHVEPAVVAPRLRRRACVMALATARPEASAIAVYSNVRPRPAA
jgi:hypothetical protein